MATEQRTDRSMARLGAEEADIEVDPGLLAHGGRRRRGGSRHVGLAPRAPRVAPGDEHVQEAPGARRGHHPSSAAARGGVAPVALLHGAAAALHGGRGHRRRRRGRAGAAVLLALLPALEPLQRRLHLLDRAHAVVRRGGAAASRGRGRRSGRRRHGAALGRAGGGGGGHREQVEVPRRRRARVLLQGRLPGLQLQGGGDTGLGACCTFATVPLPQMATNKK